MWLNGYVHMNVNVISNATYNGRIEFAKWARENGCTWNKYVICDAASNGHIEFAEWGYNVISNSAENGHIIFQRSYIRKMGS